MSIKDYIKILLKRKWTILIVIITILVPVLIINTITLPVYKATTTILISPSTDQQSIFGNTRFSPIFGGSDEIKTNINILKSYNVAQGVAEKIPSDIFKKVQAKTRKEKQESLGWPFNVLYKFYLQVTNVDDSQVTTGNFDDSIETISPTQNTINQIRNSLTINAVADTNIIEISCESNDPGLAAEIATTTAEVFAEKSRIINRSKASEATKFIEVQLKEKEKELAELEEELQNVRNVEGIADRELRLTSLERTIRVSENVYIMLLERFQESRINEVMEFIDIRIIDEALAIHGPIKPRKMLNLAIGGMLGLIIGTILVFFLEFMDNTIKNSEDVKQILQLQVLGVIPKDINRKNGRKKRIKDVNL